MQQAPPKDPVLPVLVGRAGKLTNEPPLRLLSEAATCL